MAALDFVEGIKFAQDSIDGTAAILILRDNGSIIAARDKFGRTPIVLGHKHNAYAVAMESTALPIAAVAEESGFASVYHFSRIFKRCTGMTPTAYRRICRQEHPLSK